MARRMTATPPVLAGYAYVRPLGAGGFADVFLYEQDMPRRLAAVKVLLADALDPEVRRAFNAEADVSARLSAHPAIVTIYQASVSADGRPYLAMEYCPDTMGARAKRQPLSLPEALDTGVRLAGALETAHRSGLLHRDIKPSNVLVNALGAPVLADFGIAAARAAEAGEAEVFAMSVPWSAPEVLKEEVSGSVAAEVWSLGATLYTLLAGRSPFEVADRSRNTREQLTRRIVKAGYTPLPIPGMPAQVDQLLSTAMARDPQKRYPSMAAFAERLRQVQAELGLPPTPFEVISPEWAGAAPVRFSDSSFRGPVVTTVQPDSRRATRLSKRIEPGSTDRDGLPVAASRRSLGGVAAGLIGAGVAVTLVVGGFIVARVLGVI
ncbi:serine/threonine-protein kinase [Agromyces sp. G08B096]|uniref:non-specific serine/threonine protein kinase n=1 Tax=Agromyces sp. G08B096 TaxID=3156399 RepID=A0AAU7W6M0_9MICO